ncbi:MAG TPA: PPC domain-containing protein, partial [Acidimicrobiales bacterium]
PVVVADTVIADVVTRSDCGAPKRAGSLAKLYSVSAVAGDTLTLRLTAAFNAYLVLTDSFGVSLAQNDDCPGFGTTSCIVNFGVPGPGRYVIEATTSVAGDTGTFSLSVVKPKAPAAPAGIGQFLKDGTTIAVGAVTHEDSVVFKGTLNDLNPRDSVRLEIEARVLGTPFSQAATHQSPFVAVTPGGQMVAIRGGGLVENAGYHWQARTCDNTGRCSTWLSFGVNAETAADFYFDPVLEPPAAPTNLFQYQGDSTTQIPTSSHTGGLVGTTVTVVLRGTVTDPDPGDMISLTVQVTDGTNTYTATGSTVLSGNFAYTRITVPAGLTPLTAISYTWKAQACDQTGRCSTFVSHGGSPDFLAP